MTTPYQDGYRAGHTDKYLGIRSDYAWSLEPTPVNTYSAQYGQGYRDGWHGAWRSIGLPISHCAECAQGIKHTHDDNLRKLLASWLDWADGWGDRDMRQSLEARTRELLKTPERGSGAAPQSEPKQSA
jgi:hypothetical protein